MGMNRLDEARRLVRHEILVYTRMSVPPNAHALRQELIKDWQAAAAALDPGWITAAKERFIASMEWGTGPRSYTREEVKSIVLGNLNGFAALLEETLKGETDLLPAPADGRKLPLGGQRDPGLPGSGPGQR